MKQVYDEIRKLWVKVTPEEIVRQLLLKKMIFELGYPKEYLAIEKELSMFAHLQGVPHLPQRRIDILCFQQQVIKPLLLIECKAEPLASKTLDQVLGYNAYIGAPFVAIVNQKEVKFWNIKEEEESSFFPSYEQLIKSIS